MITKERLEQLIKQGTKIYYIDLSNICSIEFNFNEYEIQFLNEYEKTFAGTTEESFKFRVKIKRDLSNWFGIEPRWSEPIYLSESFETYEDAEEYLKYGNIQKTVTLKLPTWKEFTTNIRSFVFVPQNTDDCYAEEIWVINESNKIIVQCGEGEFLYTKGKWELTRENYDKVRDLCIKLFRGE